VNKGTTTDRPRREPPAWMVCPGRGADAAPGDRVGQRAALQADEFQGLPGRCAGRHLVAALQARDQGGRCGGRVARHGDPASGAGPLLADAALMPSVPNAATAARPAPIPRPGGVSYC